jgi:hypothetical protein
MSEITFSNYGPHKLVVFMDQTENGKSYGIRIENDQQGLNFHMSEEEFNKFLDETATWLVEYAGSFE